MNSPASRPHRAAQSRPGARARPGLRIDVVGERSVRARVVGLPSKRTLAEWAAAALGNKADGKEISVRVVGRAESRKLNARYRGKDKPTNVLSFPVDRAFGSGRSGARRSGMGKARGGDRSRRIEPLGDLVVCPDVLRAEAREQGKRARAHWAHLVVHGTLHLVGYDHERPRDARRMERREIGVLAKLGFGNPYRSAS